ncbi:MAG: flagellar motor switch protein FliN [Planctomycetota bacterium]
MADEPNSPEINAEEANQDPEEVNQANAAASPPAAEISPDKLEAMAAQVQAEASADVNSQQESGDSAPASNLIDQSEIDRLTQEAESEVAALVTEAANSDLAAEMAAVIAEESDSPAESSSAEESSTTEIPERVPAMVGAAASTVAPGDASALEIPNLNAQEATEPVNNIDLLDDVELDVRIELGRTQMYIEDVLRLSKGAVVELDKLAGDPVDIYVNERIMARGEVLVLNENFCVRINEIISFTTDIENSE